MKTTSYFVFTYAFLVLIGGALGCFIAGSIPSLISATLFTLLISLNALKMYKGNIRGQQLALIQSIILGSFFVYRYQTTTKAMPAIPMIALSFSLATILLFRMPKKERTK